MIIDSSRSVTNRIFAQKNFQVKDCASIDRIGKKGKQLRFGGTLRKNKINSLGRIENTSTPYSPKRLKVIYAASNTMYPGHRVASATSLGSPVIRSIAGCIEARIARNIVNILRICVYMYVYRCALRNMRGLCESYASDEA